VITYNDFPTGSLIKMKNRRVLGVSENIYQWRSFLQCPTVHAYKMQGELEALTKLAELAEGESEGAAYPRKKGRSPSNCHGSTARPFD